MSRNRSIFFISFLFVVFYLAADFLVIVPAFNNLLVDNIKHEASHFAGHFSQMIVSESNSLLTQDELASMRVIGELIDEFDLEKLQIFDRTGRILYSSVQDEAGSELRNQIIVGRISRGVAFIKIVRSKGMASGGTDAERIILNVYVPISRDKRLLGGLGVSFDISDRYHRLNKAVLYSVAIPIFLMFLFLIRVIFLLKSEQSSSPLPGSRLDTRFRSPFFFLLVVSVSIFVVEMTVMWLLSLWGPPSVLAEALFDSSALVMILAPVLYYSLVMPLMSHIEVRIRNEKELQAAHDKLEQRVRERTFALEEANKDLKQEISIRLEYQEQVQVTDSILSNTIEGVMVTDVRGTIQRVNSSFTEITGYTAAEAIGNNPRMLQSDHHERKFYEDLWHAVTHDGEWKGEIWNRRKSGEVYPEWLSITAIKNEDGEIRHYAGVFHDISEIKSAEEKLTYQAFHDALTGLPNRDLFTDRLDTSIRHTERHHSHVGLVFVDLDNFKDINNSYGYNFGDKCLQAVAGVIKNTVRREDTVSRFDGDEYTVIMPDVDDVDDVVTLARRLLQALNAEPVRIDGNNVFVSASIGIAIYPEDGVEVETLIKNADIAMYSAKATGKNKFHLFAPEMNLRVSRRMILENALREAIEKEEFLVYYQPKVNLISGDIVGVEALVRWQRQDGTIVSPVDFIPVAEDTSLIIPIGEFVLERACRQAREWHDAGYQITVAVNLSKRQFREANLVRMVKEILSKSGLNATALELEITESLLMEKEEASIKILHLLKNEGVKMAIDDFGTGYSSLAYLKLMPIDSLKIDRAFVKGLPGDQEDNAICTAIISMAESLGMTTVAEGAETFEQYCLLRELGCTEVQGFYFSPPVEAATITGFCKEGKKVEFGWSKQ